MGHIYNGISLNYIKKKIWASFSKVDEPRAYYREWSKSKREKQISDTNAYMYGI